MVSRHSSFDQRVNTTRQNSLETNLAEENPSSIVFASFRANSISGISGLKLMTTEAVLTLIRILLTLSTVSKRDCRRFA